MKKLLTFALILSLSLALSLSACHSAPPKTTLTYLYNTSESHRAIGEYLQALFAQVGVNLKLQNQEWQTFLDTKRQGDFGLARNSWLADYDHPICFLDMWTSTSGHNDAGLGQGQHASLTVYDLDLTPYGYDIHVQNGTWAQTYDQLIATIKTCQDKDTSYALMHLAEDMLMATGCVMPIYYYTDIYLLDPQVKGFYTNPMGYKYLMHTTREDGKDSLALCLASQPQSLDPALCATADGATLISHLCAGLAKWQPNDRGEVVLVPDMAEALSEGVSHPDGSVTYTYRIKENAKWSNGDPVTSRDFAESWQRAASAEVGGSYGYLFDVIGRDSQGNLAVTTPDSATLTVTLTVPTPYWEQLLAMAVYFPVHSQNRGDLHGTWATSPATYISNGGYTMTGWVQDSLITLQKNPNYPDHDGVTMPTLQFYLSGDSNNMLTNFKNGDWQLIDDIPTGEIASVKASYPHAYHQTGLIGTYYVTWNVNKSILPVGSTLSGAEAYTAETQIRQAVATLIDRDYVVEHIAMGGQVPATSFVAMGMTDADGGQFYKNAGHGEGYTGYFDTSEEARARAKEVLEGYYGGA